MANQDGHQQDPLPLPALPIVVPTQVISAQEFFTRVPAESRFKAMQLCASALLERAGRNLHAIGVAGLLTSQDDCITWIASFLPPGDNPAPPDVSAAINRSVGFYITQAGAAPAGGGAPPPQQQQPQQILVQTEESRREEQRWIILGSFKLPRNPEGHYACLYASHWLKLRAPDRSNDSLFDSWLRLAQEFLTLASTKQHLQERYHRTIESIHCWFLMLPPSTTAITDVPTPVIKLFQQLIELFLELYLLHLP